MYRLNKFFSSQRDVDSFKLKLLRGGCNRLNIDDLISDTYLKARKSIANGNYVDVNLEGWLFIIAKRIDIDFYRRLSRSKITDIDLDVFTEHSRVNQAEDEVINLIDVKSKLNIAKYIEFLSKEQARVVNLRLRGYSFNEIAEKESISINTALGRFRYAIINLRKIMNINN